MRRQNAMKVMALLLAASTALTLVVGLRTDTSANSSGNTGANPTAPSQSSPNLTEIVYPLPPAFTDELDEVSFSIPIQNSSSTKRRYKILSNSCSCTMSQLKKSELGPGEGTELDAKIALRHETGPKSVRITLRDEWEDTDLSYVIKMQCYRKIVLPMNGLVSFGDVDALQTAEQQIPLKLCSPPGQPAVTLASATCDDDRIQLEIGEPSVEQLADGVTSNKTLLKVRLTATPQDSSSLPSIQLVARQGEKSFEETLRVHWKTPAVYQVIPPRVFFHPSVAESPPEKRVTVSRKDGKPFSISDWTGPGSFDIRTEPPAGTESTRFEIFVGLSSPAPSRHVWEKLCLKTSTEDQAEVQIPLAAFFKNGSQK